MWMYARSRRLRWICLFDSLQTNPGKDHFLSEPHKSLVDTAPGVLRERPRSGSRTVLFKFEWNQRAVKNVGDLEGKEYDKYENGGVKEEVLVDDAIGSCCGTKGW